MPDSPGTAGRHFGPLDVGPGHTGQLVDPAGPRARARARVDQDNWTTLRDLSHGPESPGAAGRHRGNSATGPCRLQQLVEPAGPGTRARVPRNSWATPRALRPRPESPGRAVELAGLRTRARVTRERWSTPRALGPDRETHRRARRTRGRSKPGPSIPGSWSTPQAHGPGPRSPGTAGGPCGTLGTA